MNLHLLTTREFAARVGRHPETVRRYCRDPGCAFAERGRSPGGRLSFHPDQVEDWFALWERSDLTERAQVIALRVANDMRRKIGANRGHAR